MAKATSIQVPVETVVTGVTLTLTPDEVNSLLAVLDCVGGDHEKTRRGDIEAISDALRDSGVELVNGFLNMSDVSRAKRDVYFLEDHEKSSGKSKYE